MVSSPRFIFTCLAALVATAATSVSTVTAFSFVDGIKARAKVELIEKVESGASNDDILEAVKEVENFSILGGAPISYKPDDDKFKGELSVSYLDEDMRISRGDQGNAFVLLRESTQREKADRIWKKWKKSW